MSQYIHENLISSYISFIDKSELCIVMPLIDAGSCLDVLQSNFPSGIDDEKIIATIMKNVLQGLNYLHENDEMHRDLKAGNIFSDKEGHIYLGDFGVSASLKKGEKRKTFVGSPCWMAPEVIEQHRGYDLTADIWSIGIICLELAEGEAPYVGMPAMKIVISIINNEPPSLKHKSKFSKEFKHFISICLEKDPENRPTTSELLKHKFLLKAEDNKYLYDTFLTGVKDLKDRIGDKLIQMGEEYQKIKKKKSKGLKKRKSIKKKKTKKEESEDMWNFGSGSYNTEKAEKKLKDETYKTKKLDLDNVLENKCEFHENKQPTKIDDDLDGLDDFGLDSDEG